MSNAKRHPSSRKTLSGDQARDIYHRLRGAYRLDDIFIRSQLLTDSPLQPVSSSDFDISIYQAQRTVGCVLHLNSDKLSTTLNLDILHVLIQPWASQNQVKTSVIFPRDYPLHLPGRWYEPAILISENDVLKNFNAIWKLCTVAYASYQPVLQVIRREVLKARHKLRLP